jgi:uncharacterized protein YndB with AHSA1/START domain
MGLEIDVQKNIDAAPATVWELLEKPPTWSTWWTECDHALAQDRRGLREGSQIELVLRPDRRPTTLMPVVELYTEEKTLSLTHRSSMVQATATFYLSSHRHGTRVRVQAVFEGLGILLLRLSGRGGVPLHTLDSALRGLKRVAERMAADPI